MRTRTSRWHRAFRPAAGLIVMALVLANASLCFAAVTERDVMGKIDNSLLVMRYFYQQKADAEYNLDLCRSARALTEKQLSLEASLLQSEQEKLDLLESKDLSKAEINAVAKARAAILEKQGLTESDLNSLSAEQRAKLAEILKPTTLKTEDLIKPIQTPIQEKLASLQKPGLSEEEIKSVGEAVRLQLMDFLKPLPQEQDELVKPVQEQKSKLEDFYKRSAATDDVMFAGREGKLLADADVKSLQEKHDMIEAEKARVRELLKRKDLTGKQLLDVETGILDYLASMHGQEENSPEAIAAKSQVQRIAALQVRIQRLQRQLKNLATFDYEKFYGQVILDSKAKIDKYSYDLQARIAEFEVLFGKKPPHVDVDFEAEMAKYRPKGGTSGYVISLE